MTGTTAHNWPQIIKDLESCGLTMYKIALMAGITYSQVKNWRDGDPEKMRGPYYVEGKLLLEMHDRYVSHETQSKLLTQTPIASSNPSS